MADSFYADIPSQVESSIMTHFNEDSGLTDGGVSPLDPSRPLSAIASFLTKNEMFSKDPMHDAMIKAMSESLTALGEQAAEEGAKNMEGAMGYIRVPYELDTAELESCLKTLRASLTWSHEFSQLTQEQRESYPDKLKLVKALNDIADISDAIVNCGITAGVEDKLLDDPSEEDLEEYFKSMRVGKSFVEVFLEPLGISLSLEPLFNDEGLDEVWKLVRVPVMTLENSAGETIRVMVVPCATHMPNWYVAVNSFRVKAMAFMEEANIHIETISTMGYANVFPEDPSEEEEEG